MSATSFLASDLCVLCGDPFPVTPYDQAECSQKRTHYFQAVLTIDPHSGPVLTGKAVIPRVLDEVDVHILGPNGPEHESSSQVTISRRSRINMQPAYCFHVFCGWGLQTKGKSSVRSTSEHVLKLAQSTTPYYPVSWEGHTSKDAAMLQRGLEMLAFEKGWIGLDGLSVSECNDVGLEGLLEMIWKRLPTETSTQVWGYLEPCATRTMLLVQSNRFLMSRMARVPPTAKVSISGAKSVCAHSILIKGSRYFCGFSDGVSRLGYSGESGGSWFRIPQCIIAIKFTIGLYGIQRLKFHGQSEMSEWIGNTTATCAQPSWTGILKFQRRPMIQLCWDDLKLRQFGVSPPEPSFGDEFMWDCDPVSITGAVSSQTWYDAYPAHASRNQLKGFDGWRLMRYLPLVKEGSRLYGITMFCSESGGIAGIETHFQNGDDQTHTQVGECQGRPIHFRMRHKEHIVSLWTYKSEVSSPFIVVQTNLGRACTFGPSEMRSRYSLRLLATKRHGAISGIYYDALKLRETAITALGVTCTDPQPLDKYEPSVPPARFYPIPGTPECMVRSVAPLNHVTTINVCLDSIRCTGMIIRYQDGSESTLGQWYESSEFDHIQIYDTMLDGSLEWIRFAKGNVGRRFLIYKISAGEKFAARPCHDSTCSEITIPCNFGSAVDWWSSDTSDQIF